MRYALLLSCCALAAPLAAQHSLIISPDVEFALRGNFSGTSAMGLVDDQETVIVTPDAGAPYDARAFRTFNMMNVMHGDGDLDGDLDDTDLYGDLNCLFVQNRLPNPQVGPFEPGEMWMSCSFNTTAAAATTSGVQTVLDGDIWRARNGTLEFFVRESSLLDALGDPAADIDIDAMCQDDIGNLWFSLWVTATVNGVDIVDGDLMHIPARAIIYDAEGLIVGIQPNSAVLWASEADMNALAANSGTFRQDGTPVTRVGDLAGLNIDPNGGVWTSPQDPSLVGPNLVFASNFLENFDNIWSTAVGGSPAVINGVAMAYTGGPADGSKIGVGLLATGQDAINALAVVPEQTGWIAVDSPNGGRSAQGNFVIEIGRVQPGTPVGVLLSLWPNDGPGGFVAAVPVPPTVGLVGGNPWLEVSLDPAFFLVAVSITAGSDGYASISLPDPGTVTPGVDMLVQGIGLPFGRGGAVFAATGTGALVF